MRQHLILFKAGMGTSNERYQRGIINAIMPSKDQIWHRIKQIASLLACAVWLFLFHGCKYHRLETNVGIVWCNIWGPNVYYKSYSHHVFIAQKLKSGIYNFISLIIASLPFRPSRKSCSLLCLWHLCWSGFPPVSVWDTLNCGERCKRTCFRTEQRVKSFTQTSQGTYWRLVWRQHLWYVILPSAHTILPQIGRPYSFNTGGRVGGTWSFEDERVAEWGHLDTWRFQPLCYSQNARRTTKEILNAHVYILIIWPSC